MKLTRIFHFDAAHHLPGYKGLCKNVHGHTWQVVYTIDGEKNSKTGMVIDFNILHSIEANILGKLDHTDLNKIFSIPTAENISEWIYVELSKLLPKNVVLIKVEVWESSDSCASYECDEWLVKHKGWTYGS